MGIREKNSLITSVRPWRMHIEQDVDGWIVSDNITVVYGDGADAVEAICDYLLSLSEYFEIIEQKMLGTTLGVL